MADSGSGAEAVAVAAGGAEGGFDQDTFLTSLRDGVNADATTGSGAGGSAAAMPPSWSRVRELDGMLKTVVQVLPPSALRLVALAASLTLCPRRPLAQWHAVGPRVQGAAEAGERVPRGVPCAHV